METKIILSILLVIWMITVFVFSNQPGEQSGSTSGTVIKLIMKVFKIKPDNKTISKMQLPIRKLAHFSLYAIGGILAILLLNQFKLQTMQKIIFGQVFVTFYAMSDEFHQYFIPGRAALVTDVMIDSIGGLFGMMIIWFLFIRG